MISTKYSQNKVLKIAGFVSLFLFALLVISKFFLPDAGNGLSDPPILDYTFMLGMGIYLSIFGIEYTYYSWTLKTDEYSEWLAVQQNNFENWLVRTDAFPSDSRLLWSSRIAGPVGVLMGVAISILMLVAIFHYFFG